MWREVGVWLLSLACEHPFVPAPLLKRLLSLLSGLGNLLENQLSLNVRVSFWAISSLPLISMLVLTRLTNMWY